MRRWAATAAPAPRPRRAAGKAAEPQQPPKAADAAGEAATPARAAECGEEAGAPGAVWTVRRKDVEDDMAADLVCFQARPFKYKSLRVSLVPHAPRLSDHPLTAWHHNRWSSSCGRRRRCRTRSRPLCGRTARLRTAATCSRRARKQGVRRLSRRSVGWRRSAYRELTRRCHYHLPRVALPQNSMGDRAELMEELTLARDQAAEEVVAVAEALAGARSEARRVSCAGCPASALSCCAALHYFREKWSCWRW